MVEVKFTLITRMYKRTVYFIKDNLLTDNLSPESRFYFLHSYYFNCDDENSVLAVAKYGEEFPCVIRFKNIFGIQFHPEKSHQNGIQLLKNFGEL